MHGREAEERRAGAPDPSGGERGQQDRMAAFARRGARPETRSRRDGAVGALVTGQLGALSGSGICLSLLGRGPKLFLFSERQLGEPGFLLDRPETLLEFMVCF